MEGEMEIVGRAGRHGTPKFFGFSFGLRRRLFSRLSSLLALAAGGFGFAFVTTVASRED